MSETDKQTTVTAATIPGSVVWELVRRMEEADRRNEEKGAHRG